MPHADVHTPLSGAQAILGFSAFLVVAVGVAIYRRWQRAAKWNEALDGAHQWAASVGGTLKRVSERWAIYSYRGSVIARRYRITFVDRDGAECIATLRYTLGTDKWEMEELTRATLQDVAGEPSPAAQAEQAAEGYARRHRAKIANVPVIFAPPRRRKPPRRST
jgi:hypothetical protein